MYVAKTYFFSSCPKCSKLYTLFYTLLLLFSNIPWRTLYISLRRILSYFFLWLHRVPLCGCAIIHFKQVALYSIHG